MSMFIGEALDAHAAISFSTEGAIAERHGETQAAIDAYARAHDADPRNEEPVLALARLLEASGNAERAQSLRASLPSAEQQRADAPAYYSQMLALFGEKRPVEEFVKATQEKFREYAAKFGGQTPLKLSKGLLAHGQNVLGTSPDNIAINTAVSYGIATAARNITIAKGSRVLLVAGEFRSPEEGGGVRQALVDWAAMVLGTEAGIEQA